MKKLLTILCVAMGLALMVGCAGKDGAAGPEGKDGTEITCTQCHANNQVITAKEWEWETTLHAVGTSWEEEFNRASCARCHNGNEYVRQIAKGGAAYSADTLTYGTNVNCRTCHEIHTTYSTDDYKLTNVAPVKLVMDPAVSLDFGKGNLCAACHQSRTNPRTSVDSQALATPPTNVKMSSRWGAHHGPQANVLGAVGGWENGGTSQSQAAHKLAANNGCVGCHVAPANGKSHRFEPILATCNTSNCHGATGALTLSSSAGFIKGTDSLEAKFVKLLNQVRDTLVGRGALAKAGMDTTGASAAVKTAYVSALSSAYGVSVVVTTVPRAVAGLAFNYMLLVEDKSEGMHNLAYSKFLLNNSLLAVNSAIVSVYP